MGAGWADVGATKADETSAVEVQGADTIRAGQRVVSTQIARLQGAVRQAGVHTGRWSSGRRWRGWMSGG
jgi:hypothetical protein